MNTIFFVLCSLFLLFLSTPAPVLAQENATEGGKAVRDTLRDRVEKKLEELTNKPRAIIGTITDVRDSSLVIQAKNGTRQIKLLENTAIIQTKKESKKTLLVKDLAIGDVVIAMGFVDTKDILETQRLLVLESLPALKRKIIYGTIEKAEKDLVTILQNSSPVTIEIKSQTLVTLASNEDSSRAEKSRLTRGDKVIVFGTPATKNSQEFIISDRIHILKDLSTVSPSPASKTSPSPKVFPASKPSPSPTAKPKATSTATPNN